ncbi:MAG TPA: Rieske 2Fe-2S domain-containing protein, partial [Pseudonocardiaceae bacterium]|nr:Rieske 2Fe-2S domain-containing protein [Pseudonocardiaceae bacterium]
MGVGADRFLIEDATPDGRRYRVIRLAALADLADLIPVTRTVRGREIAVVRCGGDVYAFDARCTHRDAPLVDG